MKEKVLIASVLLTLAGCATGNINGIVIPHGEDMFKVLNRESSKEKVLKLAQADATMICQNNGKESYKVITQRVQFIAEDHADTGIKLLNQVTNFLTPRDTQSGGESYEASTLFSCH